MNLSANLVGLLVPIAIGVCGGLLTLVGLIAVFVSISTQQHIQKMKDMHYELMQLSYKINRISRGFITNSNVDRVIDKLNDEAINAIKSYNLLVNIYDNKGEKVSNNITNIAVITILGVNSIWLFLSIYPLGINDKYFWVILVIVLFSSVIMMWFILTIVSLKDYRTFLGYHPSDLLDIDKSELTKINSLAFLGLVLQPNLYLDNPNKADSTLMIKVGIPYPFFNYKIFARISGLEKDTYNRVVSCSEEIDITGIEDYQYDEFNSLYVIVLPLTIDLNKLDKFTLAINARSSKKTKEKDNITALYKIEDTKIVYNEPQLGGLLFRRFEVDEVKNAKSINEKSLSSS